MTSSRATGPRSPRARTLAEAARTVQPRIALVGLLASVAAGSIVPAAAALGVTLSLTALAARGTAAK